MVCPNDSEHIPLMERLAFHNCDHFSTAIFSALPRKGTMFTDRQFPKCIRAVFGLPSPTFSSLQGQFIGSHRTKTTDPYGNTIAAATCAGNHWHHRHDILKFTLRDIINTTHHTCITEHGATFNGKIPTSIYSSFINNGFSLKPDLHIPHFDDNSDLAYEIKIYGIHQDYKNYTNSHQRLKSTTECMVDSSGPSTVISHYNTSTTSFDKALVPKTSTISNPFTKVLQSLHGGHISYYWWCIW